MAEKLFRVVHDHNFDWPRLQATPGVTPGADMCALIHLSIQKWEYIVAHIETTATPLRDGGPTTCALCFRFYRDPRCTGCPIAARTQRSACQNTPYDKYASYVNQRWNRHANARGYPGTDCTHEMLETARREVAFLKQIEEARCSN